MTAGDRSRSERATLRRSVPSSLRHAVPQIAIVLLVCALVYWPRLGADGLSSSEGHRAIPAWAMLESGDWLVPRLFGQVYLRKPHGTLWAIAGSSAVFGETEFAARAVSAAAMTIGSVLAFVFARRWFGASYPYAGLAAGLAHALTPWFWTQGRTAEIEGLNQLVTQAAVLLLIALLLPAPGRSRRATAWLAVGTGFAMAAVGMVKGPASAPALIGAVAATAWASRAAGAAPRWPLMVALGVAAAWLGGFALALRGALVAAGESVVAQGVDHFMWNPDELGEVALLVPTALLSAMPLSFALLSPWTEDARRLGERDAESMRELTIARAIALTSFIALAIYLAIGISNRRYTLPAFAFVSPLVGYAFAAGSRGLSGWRARAWRLVSGRAAAVWVAGLLIGAGVSMHAVQSRRAETSGRVPGIALGRAIAALGDPPGLIIADHLVEARPEVLHYAARTARAAGRPLRVSWVVTGEEPALPPPGALIALRTDALSFEADHFAEAGLLEGLEEVARGAVHKFTFVVYRVPPGSGEGEGGAE